MDEKSLRLIASVLNEVKGELRPGNVTIWADNVREATKLVDDAIRSARPEALHIDAAKRHAIWNAAMEHAAHICDVNLRDDPIGKFGVHECARDIRAAKLPLPTPLPGMEFPERNETTPSPRGKQ